MLYRWLVLEFDGDLSFPHVMWFEGDRALPRPVWSLTIRWCAAIEGREAAIVRVGYDRSWSLVEWYGKVFKLPSESNDLHLYTVGADWHKQQGIREEIIKAVRSLNLSTEPDSAPVAEKG